MVLDNAEQGEVNSHHYQGENPCDESHECGKDGSERSKQREEESKECKRSANGMEDHSVRETISSRSSRAREARVIDAAHNVRDLVTYTRSRTCIPIAKPERSEIDIGIVC